MKAYAVNSPQAMARVVAMLLISSPNLGDPEFDRLEELDFYDMIGISHTEFIEVVHAYCKSLEDDETPDGTIHLIDRERINTILDTVTDPKKRLIVAAISLDVIKANHDIDEAEMAVFTHLLEYWHLTLDDIQATFVA